MFVNVNNEHNLLRHIGTKVFEGCMYAGYADIGVQICQAFQDNFQCN